MYFTFLDFPLFLSHTPTKYFVPLPSVACDEKLAGFSCFIRCYFMFTKCSIHKIRFDGALVSILLKCSPNSIRLSIFIIIILFFAYELAHKTIFFLLPFLILSFVRLPVWRLNVPHARYQSVSASSCTKKTRANYENILVENEPLWASVDARACESFHFVGKSRHLRWQHIHHHH